MKLTLRPWRERAKVEVADERLDRAEVELEELAKRVRILEAEAGIYTRTRRHGHGPRAA